ncbi:restriction endonuclease [Flavobacterium sp. J372]|uniref:restriction endonuclease n=1 Tax=Flavobacterium sp. J372 TaxID=2898436 RepID=UPI0021507239|nr:restriction endonuclease [Flavobacterium sp. J372]MCR5863405.1 restriction endonuclease [Flavobacterium sp. J372]
MAKNDGKKLEGLVAFIEKTFIAEGCEVITNDKVYNDQGEQIAEFDAIISKPIDGGTYKWLIECRDRPSSGAAPASWIEQLFGRKERFKFDKVTAVSTTGFSPGARDRADFGGIELREMKELSPNEFGDWLTIYYQHVLSQHFELVNAEVFVENPSAEVSTAVNDALQKLASGELPGFFVPAHNTHATADALLNSVIAQSQDLANIPLSSEPVDVELKAEYNNIDDPVLLTTAVGEIRVSKIIFHTRLTAVQHTVPLWAAEYRIHQDTEKISDVATANYNLENFDINVQMHRPDSGDGGSYIEATVKPK